MTSDVAKLLGGIRRLGDAAVARALAKFDGVRLTPRQWRVQPKRLEEAFRALSVERRRALNEAARNIRDFHLAEKRFAARSWLLRRRGAVIGQRVAPVDSAGIYVPGGRFAYPSTVLMTAIPARVAGVRRVCICTPPRHLTDEVLAAAHVAGVDEIYQIGGVAAIGAMAFGTRTVAAVDLIVGPGGAWVTEAKRQVFGACGIDMLAGPSEIVMVLDGSTPPGFAAADLMAQAEHDPLARATAIGTSRIYLAKVRALVSPELRGQCRFVPAKSLADAMSKANAAAPEHLSLMVRNPRKLLAQAQNAGAVFLGPYSPVAAGDYWAGPSHVLPTGHSARFSSGLSVQTFWKRTSVIGLTQQRLAQGARAIQTIARSEGLRRHADSIAARAS